MWLDGCRGCSSTAKVGAGVRSTLRSVADGVLCQADDLSRRGDHRAGQARPRLAWLEGKRPRYANLKVGGELGEVEVAIDLRGIALKCRSLQRVAEQCLKQRGGSFMPTWSGHHAAPRGRLARRRTGAVRAPTTGSAATAQQAASAVHTTP